MVAKNLGKTPVILYEELKQIQFYLNKNVRKYKDRRKKSVWTLKETMEYVGKKLRQDRLSNNFDMNKK